MELGTIIGIFLFVPAVAAALAFVWTRYME